MATRAGLDQRMVVQAAAELADADGLHEVTLARLAARLGVQTPTLYHYVAGLAGLRRELALLGSRELADRLGKAVMGKSGDEALVALAATYREFVREHPGLYAATVQAAKPGDAELKRAQEEIVEIALRALSAYHLENDDAIHVVRMLRSLVHGFATLEQSGGFGIPLDIEVTFQRLLSNFLQSLAHTRLEE
jgi:AcrR family transcriptional regulator